jgi:hypothetical protein
MTFSIMLWMPSWGGMINGLMTLSGAWDKLRTDPVLRLLVGRRRLLRHVDLRRSGHVDQGGQRPVHYTDWTIGHVHSGALGWVGFISFGAIYCLVPWLWKRERSTPTAGRVALLDRDHRHRSLHHRDVGVRHHAGPDVARLHELGFLEYSFVETVAAMHPYYVIRALGGSAVPDRRADHGLQPVATVRMPRAARARLTAPHRRASSGRRRAPHMWKVTPRSREELAHPAAWHPRSRSRSAAWSRSSRCSTSRARSSGGGRAPLHAARAGRPQHLCPRGLLHSATAR